MTGFAKRGLPHTSNSVNLGDHNVMFKKHLNLNFHHLFSDVGAYLGAHLKAIAFPL